MICFVVCLRVNVWVFAYVCTRFRVEEFLSFRTHSGLQMHVGKLSFILTLIPRALPYTRISITIRFLLTQIYPRNQYTYPFYTYGRMKDQYHW